jgi:hypothetical protein
MEGRTQNVLERLAKPFDKNRQWIKRSIRITRTRLTHTPGTP